MGANHVLNAWALMLSLMTGQHWAQTLAIRLAWFQVVRLINNGGRNSVLKSIKMDKCFDRDRVRMFGETFLKKKISSSLDF